MIDCETVRQLALALPEVEEHEHWGRPAFRVRKKIFITLWPDEERAVLKLALMDQEALASIKPQTYSIAPWGHYGWTNIILPLADLAEFMDVLQLAWRQVAPRRVIAAYDNKA